MKLLLRKSGVDEIIAKKQPYQLLNNNREFFPSFDASTTDLSFTSNLLEFGERVAEWLRRLTRKPKVRTAVG